MRLYADATQDAAKTDTGIMSNIPVAGIVGGIAVAALGYFYLGEMVFKGNKNAKLFGALAGLAVGAAAGFAVDRYIINKK